MRRPRSKLEVSTFPFLAVLLCAMGSLLLLLFIMDRRAKIAAQNTSRETLEARKKRSADEEAERQAAWEKAKEQLHQALLLQQEELLAQTGGVGDKLETVSKGIVVVQARYGELDQKVKAEKDKIAAIQLVILERRDTIKQAEKTETLSKAELAAAAKELAELELSLLMMKSLKEREKEIYSVVPYRGKRGDMRPPIYVECVRSGAIFHPEKKLVQSWEIRPDTMREEVEQRAGPLNLMKASREKNQTPEPPKGPYVLFLIRPEGITNYYKAQAALRGYQIDFGYELVDENWALDFSGNTFAKSPAPNNARPGVTTNGGPGFGPAFGPGNGGSGRGDEPGGFGPGNGANPGSGYYGNGGSGSGGAGRAPGIGPVGVSLLPPPPGIPGSGVPGVAAVALPPPPIGNASAGGGFAGGAGPYAPGTGASMSPLPTFSGNRGGTGFGPQGGTGFGPQGVAGTGPQGGTGFGPQGVAGTGPQGGTGFGPQGVAGTGPQGGTGFGPQGVAGTGPQGGTGFGPQGVAGTGPQGGTGFGPQGVAGTGPQGAPGNNASGPYQQTNGNSTYPNPDGKGPSFVPIARTTGPNAPPVLGSPSAIATPSGPNTGAAGATNPQMIASAGPGNSTGNPANAGAQNPEGNNDPQSGNSEPGSQQGGGTSAGNGQGSTTGGARYGGGGGSGEGEGTPGIPGVRPLPTYGPEQPRKTTAPAPLSKMVGNKDFVITIDCYGDRINVFPGGTLHRWTGTNTQAADQQLVQTVTNLIARRQASVRPGEPPYRPLICFQVSAEGLRTYYHAYPLLEHLRVPMSRENVAEK